MTLRLFAAADRVLNSKLNVRPRASPAIIKMNSRPPMPGSLKRDLDDPEAAR